VFVVHIRQFWDGISMPEGASNVVKLMTAFDTQNTDLKRVSVVPQITQV
jgi:hypothetical protein